MAEIDLTSVERPRGADGDEPSEARSQGSASAAAAPAGAGRRALTGLAPRRAPAVARLRRDARDAAPREAPAQDAAPREEPAHHAVPQDPAPQDAGSRDPAPRDAAPSQPPGRTRDPRGAPGPPAAAPTAPPGYRPPSTTSTTRGRPAGAPAAFVHPSQRPVAPGQVRRPAPGTPQHRQDQRVGPGQPQRQPQRQPPGQVPGRAAPEQPGVRPSPPQQPARGPVPPGYGDATSTRAPAAQAALAQAAAARAAMAASAATVEPVALDDALPRYLQLVRKEARVRSDQAEWMAQEVRRINSSRRRRDGVVGERITDNTLIRVALDLLRAHAGNLEGTTEDELTRSVLDPTRPAPGEPHPGY